MTYKSDPIQGIFFKKEPVLLLQKAHQRARADVPGKTSEPVFFNRLRNIKTSKIRLSRRNIETPLSQAMSYEYMPVEVKPNAKKIHFTIK